MKKGETGPADPTPGPSVETEADEAVYDGSAGDEMALSSSIPLAMGDFEESLAQQLKSPAKRGNPGG